MDGYPSLRGRDGDGHADRFWSLALAVRAGQTQHDAVPAAPLEFDLLEEADFDQPRSGLVTRWG